MTRIADPPIRMIRARPSSLAHLAMFGFRIETARYRKGHVVWIIPGDGSGWKTPLMRAVERLGGQWVHRYHGYVMGAEKAVRAYRTVRRWLGLRLRAGRAA